MGFYFKENFYQFPSINVVGGFCDLRLMVKFEKKNSYPAFQKYELNRKYNYANKKPL